MFKLDNFEKFLQDNINTLKNRDLHINDNDTEHEKRTKDIYFGELTAYTNILNKYIELKNK